MGKETGKPYHRNRIKRQWTGQVDRGEEKAHGGCDCLCESAVCIQDIAGRLFIRNLKKFPWVALGDSGSGKSCISYNIRRLEKRVDKNRTGQTKSNWRGTGREKS